jgi:hypothetical protein
MRSTRAREREREREMVVVAVVVVVERLTEWLALHHDRSPLEAH